MLQEGKARLKRTESDAVLDKAVTRAKNKLNQGNPTLLESAWKTGRTGIKIEGWLHEMSHYVTKKEDMTEEEEEDKEEEAWTRGKDEDGEGEGPTGEGSG